MSREQSDGEDSVVGTGVDRFVDATAETEVELRLPLEADIETDQIPISPRAVGLDVVIPSLGGSAPTRAPGRGQNEMAQIWIADTPNSGTP